MSTLDSSTNSAGVASDEVSARVNESDAGKLETDDRRESSSNAELATDSLRLCCKVEAEEFEAKRRGKCCCCCVEVDRSREIVGCDAGRTGNAVDEAIEPIEADRGSCAGNASCD